MAAGGTPKRSAAKAWISRLGYPRRAQVGVDVAGQHVLGLHSAQGLGVAGIGGAGALGGGQLGAHVAGEVDVGGLPGLGVGVLVDAGRPARR